MWSVITMPNKNINIIMSGRRSTETKKKYIIISVNIIIIPTLTFSAQWAVQHCRRGLGLAADRCYSTNFPYLIIISSSHYSRTKFLGLNYCRWLQCIMVSGAAVDSCGDVIILLFAAVIAKLPFIYYFFHRMSSSSSSSSSSLPSLSLFSVRSEYNMIFLIPTD